MECSKDGLTKTMASGLSPEGILDVETYYFNLEEGKKDGAQTQLIATDKLCNYSLWLTKSLWTVGRI